MKSGGGTEARKLTGIEWTIVLVAIIGFAFDIYELLMLPLIALDALAELLKVPRNDPAIRQWIGYLFWGSAVSGGIFGLLGGWLTDRFGRKRVLTWSIMVYALSPLCAAFSTSAPMLLFFRCTTFIGVCVEFVAAVAWLAELFPEPKKREMVLGFTQAFSSVGGLLVTAANILTVKYAALLPAIYGAHASWRYTLISGLIPAIPLMFLLPILPESPIWKEKKAHGTLKRPSLFELFAPQLRRTTIVTSLLFACAYGAAFGAIQLTPNQIVPGTPQMAAVQKAMPDLKKKEAALAKTMAQMPEGSAGRAPLEAELKKNRGEQKAIKDQVKQAGNRIQFYQEMGGLVGRLLFACLAVLIVSRRGLLRLFQVPGLILIPLVFLFPARQDLEVLKWGMFMAGLLTVAQFSFWGNYLPRVYPTHLRGTGESFAANVGGRMIGTSAAFVTTSLIAPMIQSKSTYTQVAIGAAIMAFLVFAVGLIASFWLPEPRKETLAE
jgi:MFS family permease